MGFDDISPQFAFDEFLRYYQTADGEYKYIKIINEMVSQNKVFIRIDFNDLIICKPNLAYLLLEEPVTTLKKGNFALTGIVRQIDENYQIDEQFNLRIFNLHKQYKLSISDIRAKHTKKLYAFEGLITKVSRVSELLIVSCYQCNVCNEIMIINQEDYRPQKPKICKNPTCKNKHQFSLIIEDSKTVDHQKLTLQQYPIPKKSSYSCSLDVLVLDDLVETTNKNQIVEITGYILQWQNPRKKTEFEKLLVANSIIIKDVLIKQNK